jgi:hypothetical protein
VRSDDLRPFVPSWLLQLYQGEPAFGIPDLAKMSGRLGDYDLQSRTYQPFLKMSGKGAAVSTAKNGVNVNARLAVRSDCNIPGK